MLIQHDSQFTIRRVKSLRMRDFSIYRHDHAILKIAPLLRHIYREHVYDTVSRQSRVLHDL
jgi:hypothetical protein